MKVTDCKTKQKKNKEQVTLKKRGIKAENNSKKYFHYFSLF